jgi:hypothetical protein
MWAMWGIVIFLAGSVLALFAFGAWFIAIPLSLMAIAIALTLRLSGRISDSGELRRFRAKAQAASPERSHGLAHTPENQP